MNNYDYYDHYVEWLTHKARVSYEDNRCLMNYLGCKEFYWTVSMDANRAAQGLELRKAYFGSKALMERCSVLEMMVALAIACEEEIMSGTVPYDRTSHWFMIMLRNLGLDEYALDEDFDEEAVDKIVTNFLDRKYDRHGHGSIFYSDTALGNFKRAELWYQMCWYLTTTYRYEFGISGGEENDDNVFFQAPV